MFEATELEYSKPLSRLLISAEHNATFSRRENNKNKKINKNKILTASSYNVLRFLNLNFSHSHQVMPKLEKLG